MPGMKTTTCLGWIVAAIAATILGETIISRAQDQIQASNQVGFADTAKAIRDSADAKKAVGDFNAAKQAKTAELQQAAAAASKLDPDAKAAKEKAINEAAVQFDAQGQKFLAAASDDLNARAARVATAVAAAHHLVAVVPAAWAEPRLDFTTELTKRLDAGEGKTGEQENADLRKQLAVEKARADAAEAKAKAPPAPAATKPK